MRGTTPLARHLYLGTGAQSDGCKAGVIGVPDRGTKNCSSRCVHAPVGSGWIGTVPLPIPIVNPHDKLATAHAILQPQAGFLGLSM